MSLLLSVPGLPPLGCHCFGSLKFSFFRRSAAPEKRHTLNRALTHGGACQRQGLRGSGARRGSGLGLTARDGRRTGRLEEGCRELRAQKRTLNENNARGSEECACASLRVSDAGAWRAAGRRRLRGCACRDEHNRFLSHSHKMPAGTCPPRGDSLVQPASASWLCAPQHMAPADHGGGEGSVRRTRFVPPAWPGGDTQHCLLCPWPDPAHGPTQVPGGWAMRGHTRMSGSHKACLPQMAGQDTGVHSVEFYPRLQIVIAL